jgi:hypothetical protein
MLVLILEYLAYRNGYLEEIGLYESCKEDLVIYEIIRQEQTYIELTAKNYACKNFRQRNPVNIKFSKRHTRLQSMFPQRANHILMTYYFGQYKQLLSPYNSDSVILWYWSKFILNLIILNTIHLHKGRLCLSKRQDNYQESGISLRCTDSQQEWQLPYLVQTDCDHLEHSS